VSCGCLSADDIASHPGVTEDTVYTQIEEEGTPAHKVDPLCRFQVSEVDDGVQGGNAESTD
jgi:hypothetical protein